MSKIDVVSARQFDPDRLEALFYKAEKMRGKVNGRYAEKYPRIRPIGEYMDRFARRRLAGRNAGKVVATLFYEPSTRTRLSFESAAARMGAGLISTENAGEFSSAAKGETIEDTMRTVDKYADLIILRHPETGSAARAAKASQVPVINAGDGKGEHPTQATLDVYTIWKEKQRLQELNIIIGGDLRHGRTARSLAQIMSLYPDNRITFVSTPELSMNQDVLNHLDDSGTEYSQTDDMHTALRDADVVYWTRLQKERLTDPTLEAGFTIGSAAMAEMSPSAILMHPLPRVGEITQEVDHDPRAVYFDQVEHGLYIRMAMVDQLLRGHAVANTLQTESVIAPLRAVA